MDYFHPYSYILIITPINLYVILNLLHRKEVETALNVIEKN